MGYRRFTDRDGVTWEVRDQTFTEWVLQPVGQPGVAPVRVRAPVQERDPFEVSTEDLQRMLDAERPRGASSRKNPFQD
jgi:hypothetical protein